MRQLTDSALDSTVRYRSLKSASAMSAATEDMRSLFETWVLFVVLCAFWGTIVAAALTGVLR